MPKRFTLKKKKTSTTKSVSATPPNKSTKSAKRFVKKPTLKSVKSFNFKSLKLWTGVLLLGGLVILSAGVYLYYQNIFTNQDRIFYGMIEKSLETDSVSREITQRDGNRTEKQNYLVTFTPTPLVMSKSNVEQVGQAREISRVSTETIGTRDTDFVRYTQIDIPSNTGDQTDYSQVENTWAKREGGQEQGQAPQFLNEAIFTFIPFGNFDNANRAELMQLIKDEEVYRLGNDGRVVYEGVRPMYEMSVMIKPRGLVETLKRYAEITGLGDQAMLNPEQYDDRYSFAINVRIDMLTKHLAEISYPGETRTETYQSYGLNRNIELPETTISIEELQSRIQ